MELEPRLILDFADEKFPRDLHFDMDRWTKERGNYINPGSFVLSNNIFVSTFSFDGNSRYAITDIAYNKTISPFTSTKNEYGFVLSGFPDFNFRPFFIEGYLAGILEASKVKSYLNIDSKSIPDKIKTRLQELDENDNPVLVLSAWK